MNVTRRCAPARRFLRETTRWLLLLSILLASGEPLPVALAAQTNNVNVIETNSFYAAARAFQDGLFERAEREFEAFARQFPQSAQLPEAYLLQARAALRQQKMKAAIDLLSEHMAAAGAFTEQYRYWLAEALLQNRDFEAAGRAFGQFVQDFPGSIQLLEASYGEALARFKLGEWDRAASLLQNPEGTFQRAAKMRANDELVARGYLLLGEALFENKQFAAADQAVQPLAQRDLSPELKWRLQYLPCRVQLASNRLADALAASTNLTALAAQAGQRNLQAESFALQAGLLERMDRPDAAIQAYTNNLAENFPAGRRREALLKIIELTLAQNQVAEAARKLEGFFTQHPDDAASDVAVLTLGELHLRQYEQLRATNAPPFPEAVRSLLTNHLQEASSQFARLTEQFPQSPLVGKAFLDKGWCLWEQGNVAESETAFKAAVEKLTPSEDQAVARFKLADAQFMRKDYTNALQNYNAVLENYDRFPRVKQELFDHALYQVVRASLEIHDLPRATMAMKRILEDYPKSFYGERGLLLVGQNFTAGGQPAEARRLFQYFIQRYPSSELRPQVELAIARTYVEQRNWEPALKEYDDWLTRFATNELRPRAEFTRAWIHYQAGQESNAFTLFTNFVASFPDDGLAPLAQQWVGDFFYNQGDYVNAQKAYQKLAEAYPGAPIARQARMMAGRAAFANQLWNDAAGHFTALVNDENCPPEVKAEAFFALGDTMVKQDGNPGNALEKFDDAKEAFRRIPQLYPTSRLVPQAWGRIGDCYLQMAAKDPSHYASAREAYQKALSFTNATWNTRSQAEMGLGIVDEAQAQQQTGPDNVPLLQSALNHYSTVLYGKNLQEDDQPEAVWLKESGLAAARVAENLKRWDVAINLYNRLMTLLPPLRTALERKVEKAREQLRHDTN